MPLTELAFWVLYVGGLLAAVWRPLAGVLLYILVYHLNPENQWWGESVRGLGLRTSLIVAGATVVGLLLRWPRLRRPARQFPLPILLMIALAAYAVLGLVYTGEHGPRSLYQTEKFLKILIFVLILIRCVRTPADVHCALLAWLAGVGYIGYQAWGKVGVWRAGRLDWGLGGPDFAESSDLSAHLIATLPMIGAAFFMARGWLGRTAALLLGALAVNALIMTRTRNALVGLLAICAAAVLALPRGYRVRGGAAVLLGLVLTAQLADPGWWRRMESIADYRSDAAVMERLRYWSAAVAMALDQPLGIGAGNFQEQVRAYVPGLLMERSAHNTFLECLAELGLPGFLMLVVLVATTLARLWRVRRTATRLDPVVPLRIGVWRTRFHLGWHACALLLGLIGYLACGMFTTRLWAEDFWLLIGLSCCLVNVAAEMQHASRQDPAPQEARPAAPPRPLPLGAPGAAHAPV